MRLACISVGIAALCLLSGCAQTARDTGGQGNSSGTGVSGTKGGAGNTPGHAGSSGSAGGSPGGTSGTDAGTGCPSNIAIPTLCRLCSNGSCGAATCSSGKFSGFVCPEDANGAAGSGGACNLACVKGEHCALTQVQCVRAPCPPVVTCVDDASDAGSGGATQATCGGFAGLRCAGMAECVDVPGDGCDPMTGGADCSGMCECSATPSCDQGSVWNSAPDVCACVSSGGGTLHWYQSCGAPVCSNSGGNFDDPSIPNCTTQQEAQSCSNAGDRCDGVFTCGATLICASEAPRTCPVSRASYKQAISYLDDAERQHFHRQITQLPLASYRYKTAPDVPQLGFMIDDVEPSVAVAGDHVNMYGYLSMAVAAIQVQDQQIKALERQVEQLRSRVDESSPGAICVPESR